MSVLRSLMIWTGGSALLAATALDTVAVAGRQVQQPEVGVGRAVVRVEGQRPLEGGARLGGPPEARLRGPEQIVGGGVSRVGGDRRLRVSDGRLRLVLREREHGSVVVRGRRPGRHTAEIGHRSAVPGHLSLIALRTNRTLKWDPAKEEIIGDAEASKLLRREYRSPWKLA